MKSTTDLAGLLAARRA